jgi:hypothetical protein
LLSLFLKNLLLDVAVVNGYGNFLIALFVLKGKSSS